MSLPPHFRAFAALGMCVLLVACVPVSASAQQVARSFQELQARVKIGDIVFVIDGSNLETRGKVETLSDVSLGLTVDGLRRGFDESSIARIDRTRRDSVRNGLLIGLGSGAILGFLAGTAADSPTCPRPGIECGQGALLGTVGGAFWGGVGGWLIDALVRKREAIYLAPARP
jgi:uncharacterized membrane protein (Fun14 family)